MPENKQSIAERAYLLFKIMIKIKVIMIMSECYQRIETEFKINSKIPYLSLNTFS